MSSVGVTWFTRIAISAGSLVRKLISINAKNEMPRIIGMITSTRFNRYIFKDISPNKIFYQVKSPANSLSIKA